MNYQLLKTEIERPEYAGKSDAEIAALLNEPRDTGEFETFSIPRRTLKSWLISINKLDAIMSGTDPLSKTLAFFLTDPDYPEIAIFDPLTQQLFGAAVAGGMFTPEQKSDIESKARRPIIRSFADEMGRQLDYADIERARTQN